MALVLPPRFVSFCWKCSKRRVEKRRLKGFWMRGGRGNGSNLAPSLLEAQEDSFLDPLDLVALGHLHHLLDTRVLLAHLIDTQGLLAHLLDIQGLLAHLIDTQGHRAQQQGLLGMLIRGQLVLQGLLQLGNRVIRAQLGLGVILHLLDMMGIKGHHHILRFRDQELCIRKNKEGIHIRGNQGMQNFKGPVELQPIQDKQGMQDQTKLRSKESILNPAANFMVEDDG